MATTTDLWSVAMLLRFAHLCKHLLCPGRTGKYISTLDTVYLGLTVINTLETQLEEWAVDSIDTKVETSPLHQYDAQITSYLAMVKEAGKVVAKREKAVRTLDFYRGEVCAITFVCG